MEGPLKIKQWAEADRPREKLLSKGVEALSDSELLAILIGSGYKDMSAVALMQHILKDCDHSLQQLGRKKVEELMAYKGVGEAKAITIIAACELGRRRMMEKVAQTVVKCGQDIADYYRLKLGELNHEECHVILLRQNLSVIDTVLVGRGGLAGTSVDIRIILEQALLKSAAAIVLCHNHPSGCTKPSKHDESLTLRLKKACDLMDIKLIDHIIVSASSYYSFNEHGLASL
ncbi:MAG: DNA repair protein RadC [Bacteroidaceae bacterium]